MHRKQLFIAFLLLPLLSAAAGRHSSAPLPAAETAAVRAAAQGQAETEVQAGAAEQATTAGQAVNGGSAGIGGQAGNAGQATFGKYPATEDNSTAEATTAAGEADPAGVDTVIVVDKVQVTAIKQGMVLRSQPVAAAIVGSRAIERGHVDALKNLSQNVPHFYVPDYGSRMTSSIYVRGRGARIDQPVMGLNIDNVPVLNKDNYDMELARRMVQGVDVWLNTPTRPLEASGTSGEKCVMNGVLQFSVLDGWWVEGYKEGAGSMLPMARTFADQHYQDELDAEMIYNTIEEQIVPKYYDRDRDGVPHAWVESVKKCVADIASNFTTNRMLNDYEERFYNKLAARKHRIVEGGYKLAREIAAWKRKVSSVWDQIRVIDVQRVKIDNKAIFVGEKYHFEVTVDIASLRPEDIGVEMVIAQQIVGGQNANVMHTIGLKHTKTEGSRVTYALDYTPDEAGTFDVALRIFPVNPHLPHRMDFALVKWA